MMRQKTTVVLFVLLLAFGTSVLRAQQEMSRDEFQKAWAQGIDLEDDKLLDKAVRGGARHAIRFYEELWTQAQTGNVDAEFQAEKVAAAWEREFGDRKTPDEVKRWVGGAVAEVQKQLRTIRTNADKLWGDYSSNVSKLTDKEPYEGVFKDYVTLAKAAEGIGHYLEAAELWGLASVVGNKMPGKSIEDRESVVFAIEQQLAARDRWGYTFDTHYKSNKVFVESELARIKEDKEKGEKREAEGYSSDAKGLEALLMPGAKGEKFPLEFAALKEWDKELDYGPKGGPVPPFWWLDSVGENGTSRKMGWFRARDLYLVRRGANEFAVSWTPEDNEKAFEIDASARAKPSLFYLGENETVPYSMFFWLGSDQESTGLAKVNYAPTTEFANIFYRTASSWETTIGSEKAVFYDDDCSGRPGNAAPFEGQLRSHLIGDPLGEGEIVPLFDSMQIGKGSRVPQSQFVKLESGWHHLDLPSGVEAQIKPLNPEYFKTGKIKLNWSGPKTSMPAQLVIQGKGDYQTAMFDVASAKEVEVPAGEYSVIWGRVVNGKGARVQTAQIYPSEECKPFTVEAGQTFELELGAPFRIEFTHEADGSEVTIPATSIHVRDKAGLMFVGLHGTQLDCEVVAAKDEDGKGKKEIGEFVPFTNDQLIATASNHYRNLGTLIACYPMPKGYREGEMVLKCRMPSPVMKVGLAIKKHKLFGKLETVWK